jgi:hypothetical protein
MDGPDLPMWLILILAILPLSREGRAWLREGRAWLRSRRPKPK